MAIGMAIGVLAEALLPGGGEGGGGKPPPKNKAGSKEWVRNKLKALEGRLGVKAAEALPSIIGVILSWILNKASDVLGLASQNLYALVVSEVCFTSTWLPKSNVVSVMETTFSP